MSRLTATCRCRPCDRPRLRRTSHGLHRQPCGSHRRAGHENGPEARHEKFTNRWNARCAIQRLCHLAEGSCSSAGACSCATKVAFRVSVRCRKPLGLRRRAVRDEGRRTSGRRAARRAGGAKHLPATQPSFRGRAPAPSSRRCFNVQLSKNKTPKGLGGSRLGYPWLLRLTPETTCPLNHRVQKGGLVQSARALSPRPVQFRPMFIGLKKNFRLFSARSKMSSSPAPFSTSAGCAGRRA